MGQFDLVRVVPPPFLFRPPIAHTKTAHPPSKAPLC